MDTYPCLACGGVANATDGCRSCGRAHDPDAARLAEIKQAMATLEARARRQGLDPRLEPRWASLQSQRSALTRAVAIKLAAEQPARRRAAPRQRGRVRQAAMAAAARTAASRTGPAADEPHGRSPTAHPGPVAEPEPQLAGAETSPRGAQNTLLTLGGVLIGIAAVVFTGLYYSQSSGGRAFVLAVATTLCLGVPVLLARRTLTATAETITSIGLLLLLLDGYTAYTANFAGLAAVAPPLFAAVLFLLVAGVASAYRLATHLRAPQFAALLAVQPWLPLVGVQLGLDRVGFAAVLALVAGGNLGAVALFGTELKLLAAARRLRPRNAPATGTGWPRMLRELAWLLYGISLAAGTALAVTALIDAQDIAGACLAGLSLLLVAGAGIAGGQISGRETARQVGLGAAALCLLGAVARVNVLALPHFTLVLTAATAVAIALAASLLPPALQRGPQLGALAGAVLTALVVVGQAAVTAVATVQAATTPQVWAADLVGYARRVASDDWQVAATALLLTILAAAATPTGWRVDATIVGATVALLALPGTGALPWWAPALLATAASSAATFTSLFAPNGRSALIRSGAATLLGLYAVATGLSTAPLTATVCTALALSAATTAVAAYAWPRRFGQYADRVADSAAGAAAFTLPIAVGTLAWLGQAPARILVPLTLLATGLGVLGAALSQVAAGRPRMASANGALAAALGTAIFSLLYPHAALADRALAGLLLVAAIAAAASRAFEISPGGLVEGATAIPAAVGALARDLLDRPEPPRSPQAARPRSPQPARPRWRLPGTAIGAGLATAAVILTLARLLASAGIGLVTTMAMVLVLSSAVRILPDRWRGGPRLGSAAVGAALLMVCAAIALGEAGRAVAASLPHWNADLAGWRAHVTAWTPFGWQVPATLLLAAVAAWILLPPPAGGEVGFVTLSLAGLALPAAAGLDWWAPTLIAGGLAVAAGCGAALVSQEAPVRLAHRRLGMAALLGGYAVVVAGATAGLTGMVLSGIVAAGVVVAGIAQLRGPHVVDPVVSGVAAAAALAAGPGAAATLAVANGFTRAAVLGAALGIGALGVVVVWALRASGAAWGAWPAAGVGVAALVTALAALPDAQLWAGAAALVAALGAAAVPGSPRESGPDQRGALAVIVATAGPAAAIAALASAPAWWTALVGPYRTLREVWGGYAVAPAPQGAAAAVLTLLLLTATAAAIAIRLGGGRYLLASILPPLAALVVLLPAAFNAPRGATAWAALGVALATGLGAAGSPPTLPSAARLLRATAGVICAVTGAAGIAGSLATASSTLIALAVLAAGAGIAALAGRDPAVRMVAWVIASAAAFALPVTALAAAGRDLRPAAFAILGVCAALTAVAWYLARTPAGRGEAATVELCGWIGATFALLLALGSARHAAAVLTIWGLLLGGAALRRDRPARLRQWLVRAALAAELGACWLLLYAVQVGLPEAYTLPFAGVALLAGALELGRRPELSSWAAYGPALAGGFLPSLALVLVSDAEVWRWVTLFVAAIGIVLLGSWRRRRAPVVTGAAVAIVVALVEMIKLLVRGVVAGAILVAVAGAVLIAFGALSEKRLRGALRKMS